MFKYSLSHTAASNHPPPLALFPEPIIAVLINWFRDLRFPDLITGSGTYWFLFIWSCGRDCKLRTWLSSHLSFCTQGLGWFWLFSWRVGKGDLRLCCEPMIVYFRNAFHLKQYWQITFVMATMIYGSNRTGNNSLWACVPDFYKIPCNVSELTYVMLHFLSLKRILVPWRKREMDRGYSQKVGNDWELTKRINSFRKITLR